LNCHGDAITASIRALLGGVVDNGCQQETDGDG
jgi:hypothetical protein